jgi:hypothetical protein
MQRNSAGCITCHAGIETPSMHASQLVKIGCAECHGGDPRVARPTDSKNARPYDAAYLDAMAQAHPQPLFPEDWNGTANPVRSYALLNRERLEYVRFINPSDLRAAPTTCGPCHALETKTVPTSIMAHSAMVPGAGLYNNGAIPLKTFPIGDLYATSGESAIARMDRPLTQAEKDRGLAEYLIPYPRWENSQPGNLFRAFERGGDAGFARGLGTLNKVDAVFLTANKTRLNDPYLWFLGTNDYAIEYRTSGCGACHVIYANDDGPSSGPFAHYGRRGYSFTKDPTIPKDERGHPIRHTFTRNIPSSQCITCHSHQGSGAVANYIGAMWWDGDTEADYFYNPDGSKKA